MTPPRRHPEHDPTAPDLAACVAGDPVAWAQFVERYGGVILATVRRVMGTKEPGRVEDPVQDVWVRLVRNDFRLLRTFDPDRASLPTWLALIARSVAIDHLRRARRHPAEALREDAQEVADHSLPDTPGTIESPASRGIPMHLLSGRQRLVLRLLFDEERSVAEAAAILDVDHQTIRSTKHKALTRLRNHFKKAGDDAPAAVVSPDQE